ncbi:UPF0280 family protein [Nanoarchaeota archaeon]
MAIYKQEKLHKDSRVKILCDKEELIDIAFNELISQRKVIEDYIKNNPEFETSLKPIENDPNSPNIIKEMISASKNSGTGPMAAVAGLLAEKACKKISNKCETVIVENGGDIFISTKNTVIIGLFSGKEHSLNKLAFRITPEITPLAICSSSGKMGHSLSFGEADVATVFSKSAALADCVATNLANKIKTQQDLDPALEWANTIEGIIGAIAVKNERIGMIGTLPELIKHSDEKLKEKVTKDPIYNL